MSNLGNKKEGFSVNKAERVGFEPTVVRVGHNGFRDRPDQPLWHLSRAGGNYNRFPLGLLVLIYYSSLVGIPPFQVG
jgi:hypothetical protein